MSPDPFLPLQKGWQHQTRPLHCHRSADMISHKACANLQQTAVQENLHTLAHSLVLLNLGDINDIFCLMNAYALEEDTVADSMPSLAKSIMIKGLFSSLHCPYAHVFNCLWRPFVYTSLGGCVPSRKNGTEGIMLNLLYMYYNHVTIIVCRFLLPHSMGRL